MKSNTDKAKIAYARFSVIKKQDSRAKKPHETRPDWAILYATRKRKRWQSDFGGVTRLAASRDLYWLNAWERPESPAEPHSFKLSIKAKDGSGKAISCQLRTAHGHLERYFGLLQLSDGVCYEITLCEDAGCLRIHFELEGGAQ